MKEVCHINRSFAEVINSKKQKVGRTGKFILLFVKYTYIQLYIIECIITDVAFMAGLEFSNEI